MRKLFAKSYYGGGYFALFLIGVTVIGMLAFAGCSFAPEEGRTGSAVTVDSGYATPYASVEELEAIAEESDEYVYWRVARTFALIELEAFREEAVWYNATLSERPVVVYDSKSRPKYYEYRVLRNGEEIGAVTAVAQKKDGGPTAYVLPSPGDYSGLQTKGSGFKVVANMYPRVAYGLVTKSGEDVNVAVDPVSGDMVDLEEDILEFALKYPEYFTNEGFTIDDVVTMANNFVASNQLYWLSMEEIFTNLIYFSTNEAFFEELAQAETKAKDFGNSSSSTKVIKGRVVNSFQGTQTDGWWNPNYVFNSKCLKWDSSPLTGTFGTSVWCGPGAAGIALTYYGYTNKIRCYSTYKTNYTIPSETTEIEQNVSITGFISQKGTFTYNIYFYDDTKQGMIIGNLIVDQINIGNGGKALGYSITKVSGGYLLTVQIYAQYSHIDIRTVVHLKFTINNIRHGDLRIDGDIKSNKRIGYSIVQDSFYDGYYEFGRKMGIKDFSDGGTSASDVKNGIIWASDGEIGVNIFSQKESLHNNFAKYNAAKNMIERNDLFISGRGFWLNHDEKDEKGNKGGGHWRTGVGYREINYYKFVDKSRVVWWVLFIPILEWYKSKELDHTTYWYLLTDNGYEGSSKLYNNPGEREYIKKSDSKYCQNIFWEKYWNSNYVLNNMLIIYKKGGF